MKWFEVFISFDEIMSSVPFIVTDIIDMIIKYGYTAPFVCLITIRRII